jgi:hypothetical protein
MSVMNAAGGLKGIKARYPRLSTNVIRSVVANLNFSGNIVANLKMLNNALKKHDNLARSGIIERVANLNNALPKPKYKRPTKFKPKKSALTTMGNLYSALNNIQPKKKSLTNMLSSISEIASALKKKKKKRDQLGVQKMTRFKK